MAKMLVWAIVALAVLASPCAWAAEGEPLKAVSEEVPPPTVAIPIAPAAEAPRSPVLDYVPGDADVAAFFRFGQLARTKLWARFASTLRSSATAEDGSPEAGLWQKLVGDFPLKLDFEKDVAAFAYVYESPPPADAAAHPRIAICLELTRDADLAALLKEPWPRVMVEGIGAPVYGRAPDMYAAMPAPRLVVLASHMGYLVKVLKAPEAAAARPPGSLPAAALAAPGEIAFAAVVSGALKGALRNRYAAVQRERLRPGMDTDDMLAFSLQYNLIRLILETETVTGSLDLSRDADAVRAEVRFGSRPMAPFFVAILQAMADPVQMCLPAMMGGQPLEEPPPEPLYLATADGPAVRITMSRAALERLIDRLARAARAESARQTSAENLRRLGIAIRAFAAKDGAPPRTWSDLVRDRLITDMSVLENPALATHLVTGDYELVPLSKETAARDPWQRMQAYEVWPKDAPPPALNVLFADGHVEYVPYEHFKQVYRQTIEALGH